MLGAISAILRGIFTANKPLFIYRSALPGGPGLVDIIKENLKLIFVGVAKKLTCYSALKPTT
jgi:hypothetical protein